MTHRQYWSLLRAIRLQIFTAASLYLRNKYLKYCSLYTQYTRTNIIGQCMLSYVAGHRDVQRDWFGSRHCMTRCCHNINIDLSYDGNITHFSIFNNLKLMPFRVKIHVCVASGLNRPTSLQSPVI